MHRDCTTEIPEAAEFKCSLTHLCQPNNLYLCVPFPLSCKSPWRSGSRWLSGDLHDFNNHPTTSNYALAIVCKENVRRLLQLYHFRLLVEEIRVWKLFYMEAHTCAPAAKIPVWMKLTFYWNTLSSPSCTPYAVIICMEEHLNRQLSTCCPKWFLNVWLGSLRIHLAAGGAGIPSLLSQPWCLRHSNNPLRYLLGKYWLPVMNFS